MSAYFTNCWPRKTRRRAVLGCLPRGDRAVLLYAARALACAASVVAVGATVTAAMPRRAIGEAADALESVGLPPPFPRGGGGRNLRPQRVPRPFVDVSPR